MINTRHRGGLCAAALLGIVFLHRLAERVEPHALNSAVGAGSIASCDDIAIFATDRLIAFARTHGPFDSDDELALAIRGANLEGTWFGFEFEQTLNDGRTCIYKQFIPLHQNENMTFWTKNVLATLAGRPASSPMLDFRGAEILVIDDSYMKRDPFDAMEELTEMRLGGHWSKHRSRQMLNGWETPPASRGR